MVAADKEVMRAVKSLVKISTGQDVSSGYPYVEGDILVFKDGASVLEKKEDKFQFKFNGKTVVPFSDADTFIDCCGLAVDELEIPE